MRRRSHGEGTLFKRSDGTWIARMTLPSGKRVQVASRDRQEAKRRWDELRRQINDGLPIHSRQITLSQLLDHWLESWVKVRRSPTTYAHYNMVCKTWLKPKLGSTPLIRLRQDQVERMLSSILDIRKPSTVRAIHNVLKAALSYATKREITGRNVAALIECIPVRQKRAAPLDDEDVRALIGKMRDHPNRALFLLALASGMRQGEILGLRWSDLDWERSSLRVWNQVRSVGGERVELKTERSHRTINLPGIALEALREYRSQQRFRGLGRADDLMFVRSTGGDQPIPRTVLRRQWKDLLKESGLPSHHRFHDLRHTAVSLLLEEGVPLHEVSKMVGHSSVNITADIYGHLSPERRRAAADAMEERLRRSASDY